MFSAWKKVVSCFVQQELIAGLNCWSLGTVVFGNKYGGCEGCVADQVKGRYARCVVYPAHQVRAESGVSCRECI